MEPIMLKLSDEKTKLYNGLFEKYSDYTFNNIEEEQKFLNHLKDLLNEDENDIEFEVKIMFLEGLSQIINLKKFGGCYSVPFPVSK